VPPVVVIAADEENCRHPKRRKMDAGPAAGSMRTLNMPETFKPVLIPPLRHTPLF